MTLIDKKKVEAFMQQYEQLLKYLQEHESLEQHASLLDIETIRTDKEELDRVFSQYQLQYNELQYLVSRYETLQKNMRLRLRNIKIKTREKSQKDKGKIAAQEYPDH